MRKYLAVFCGILSLGIALSAQELKHNVTVTLKLIQVYVTNRAGNPVTDLQQNEFIVYDNKKLQRITEFEKHVLFPLNKTTGSQPAAQSKAQPIPKNDIMNRKFFFFFDLANNNAKGFQKAQDAALYFLDHQVQPSDEVGVISYSVLKQLTLHEYLTRDRQVVRRVVKALGGMGRVGRAENFEAMVWRQMSGESALDASQYAQPVKEGIPAQLKDPASSALTKSGYEDFAVSKGAYESNNRFKRDEYKSQVRNLFSRIIDLSRAMRYISGHKHLIFFSSGIPYSLIHGVETANPFQPTAYGVDTVLRNKFEKMLKELSASNTTVFSVDTETLATNMNLPANQKGESTLRRISHYTGGKFIGNVQNYTKILDTVQTFTGAYYVLGYYVDENWNGRYNSIKVDVTRPGCRVFAQKGYFNPKPFSKYSKMEKELHLIDLALSERPLFQVPVPLTMTALPCPIKKKPGVLLLAGISEEEIKKSVGQRAEIYFLVFDNKENLIDVKRKAVRTSTLKGRKASFYSLLPLPPGEYKFSIVMRDMDKGSGAVGRCSVEIPEVPKQGLKLFPPLLLIPGKSGLYVRGYVPKTKNKSFPLLSYFPFDPTRFSPVMGKIPGSAHKMQAVLHCSIQEMTKPLLKFTAVLINKSSDESLSLPVSILSGEKESGMGTLLAEFRLPDLEIGSYILVITAEDITTGVRSQASAALDID